MHLAPLICPREDLAPFSQEIYKLCTTTLWSMKARSNWSTKSCSHLRIARKLEIVQNAKSCSKYEQLPKSCRITRGNPSLGRERVALSPSPTPGPESLTCPGGSGNRSNSRGRTQGTSVWNCAAEAFKTPALFRQKLLISLSCLRQDILLFVLQFASVIKTQTSKTDHRPRKTQTPGCLETSDPQFNIFQIWILLSTFN